MKSCNRLLFSWRAANSHLRLNEIQPIAIQVHSMATRRERTVLLVDDDEGVLAILEHTMAQQGWRILAAENGEQALQSCRDQIDAVDLVITDLQMPEMNGNELAKRLRELKPALPIIFVSGDSGSDLADAVKALPNHRYLKKPFRTSELAELVTNFVG
jgi:two-component system cell cycle sensor histidine kinase/response regulator CckA